MDLLRKRRFVKGRWCDAVVKVDQRIRWHYSDYTITILHFRIGAWQHEVSKLYSTLALSAGTLMASASTPYRLVPAHFYPWCDVV